MMETETMLGKINRIALLSVGLLACAALAAAAPTAITQLDLTRDGSFTVLTIQGTGQVRYAHQSVEAKEGRPFRIVIDCLASRHELPRKVFGKLPKSAVTAIRTSQYSVTPEEVVRIVLDLVEESVYRIETGDNAIKIFVSDQKTAPFERWTTATLSPLPDETEPPAAQPIAAAPSVVKPTMAEKPQDLAQKPVAVTPSTSSKPESAPVPTTAQIAPPTVLAKTPTQKPAEPAPVPEVAKPSVLAQKETSGQTLSEAVKKPVETAPAPVEKPMPAPVTTAQTPPAPSISKPMPPQSLPAPIKNLAYDSVRRAITFAAAPSSPEPKAEAVPVKPAPAVVDDKKQTETPQENRATEPTVVEPPPTSGTEPSEEQATNVPSPVFSEMDTVPATTSDEANLDLSRYRRETAKSVEKATTVVEFPQRMGITYAAASSRDPFETLVEIGKNNRKNVDMNKVPNVEALNLVGILESIMGHDAALMEDLDGIGYILRPGDRVQSGFVTQIDDKAVSFQINEYGWSRTVVKYMDENN